MMRKEAGRLLKTATEADCAELLQIYIDFLFSVIENNHNDKFEILGRDEANIIVQMIATKLSHLQNIISGINFNGRLKNNIIDVTVLATLERNIYEAIGAFYVIFVNPKSEQEKVILYNLWKIAGLNYRQRFSDIIQSEANRLKGETEKIEIQDLTDQIYNSKLFLSLDGKNQKKIREMISRKDYKIRFENKNVFFLDWKDIPTLMGFTKDHVKHLYTFFSLYSHPSYVSVFQYADMFKDHDKAWKDLTVYNLKSIFLFISTFIAEYIRLKPTVLATFAALPLQKQIAIDWQNTYVRSHEYSINNCIRELD